MLRQDAYVAVYMKQRREHIDPLADLLILVWYTLGPKQTVANYRLFVPD